jgi:ubiquinone/menaquinone biosynthesis C-methylase UbiE
MGKRMMGKSSSLFDFGSVAGEYDSWYETPVGKAYDEEEKSTVLELLPTANAGDRLLDVGCGTGHWSRFFASLRFEVVGVDISPEMIEVARSQDGPECHFEIADAGCLPFDGASFEVVTAMATLEFVADPEAAVAEMFRCAKRGGSIIVGTLNEAAPLNRDRVAKGEEPYVSAHLFSAADLLELLIPYGRVRMRVSSQESGPRWFSPLRTAQQWHSLRWGQPTGAFLVAEVRS